MATVLIIDDDSDVVTALGAFFEHAGHQVVRAQSGEEGIEAFQRARPDLVLLDLRLPDTTGFDVLTRLGDAEPVVIMITAHGDVPLAVEAMQQGAENFLEKPVDLAHLSVATDRALEKARLRQLARFIRDRRSTRASSLLGTSPAMRELAHQIEILAASDRTTVLLLGEGGSGKGRMAQAIHLMSARADRAYIELNCAGFRGAALETELFGQEAAGAPRIGLAEAADGGTLFLDEVALVDPTVQPKLLTLLEDGTLRRVGGTRDVAVDVRVIAATTRDLVEEVNAGRFREDLYYRLSVMPTLLPPLRARAREDLVGLIHRVMHELRQQLPNSPVELSDLALEQLLRHAWPGNIRELRNVLERAMIVGRGARRIAPEHLPAEIRRAVVGGAPRHIPRSLAEVERAHIERTLRAHVGNRTRAARELGISRATLINKIREYGLGQRDPAHRA